MHPRHTPFHIYPFADSLIITSCQAVISCMSYTLSEQLSELTTLNPFNPHSSINGAFCNLVSTPLVISTSYTTLQQPLV